MVEHIYISAQEAFQKADELSQKREPFFIAVDFDLERALFYSLMDIPDSIHVETDSVRINNFYAEQDVEYFSYSSIDYSTYKKGFDLIQNNIHQGNSYLLNYSAPTEIDTNLTLSDIYGMATAKYKLLIDDEFVVFSPESFIKITNNKIATFPMKGTINANLPNAEAIILGDAKEIAEHATIVDLMRNDLSQIADNVSVLNYRYIETVETLTKDLLQVSSHIVGDLLPEYHNKIGSVLARLLPAGSVSGAPKQKTVDIIHDAESCPRGFYCGVMGVFNGKEFDSGVLIRFIEQTNDGLQYRSGGGITFQSDVIKEYNELNEKIYVPIA